MTTEFMNITVAGSLIPLQQKDLSMQGVIERFRLSRTGGTGPRPQHAYSQVAAVYAAVKIKAEITPRYPQSAFFSSFYCYCHHIVP